MHVLHYYNHIANHKIQNVQNVLGLESAKSYGLNFLQSIWAIDSNWVLHLSETACTMAVSTALTKWILQNTMERGATSTPLSYPKVTAEWEKYTKLCLFL